MAVSGGSARYCDLEPRGDLLKKIGLRFLAALSIYGCSPPVDFSQTESGKALVARLKDPGSAEFGSVWTDGGNACGWVNAKNSFGGYVGIQRFIANPNSALLERDPASPEVLSFDEMWELACGYSKRVLSRGPQPIPEAD